jgi:hypothetical protein
MTTALELYSSGVWQVGVNNAVSPSTNNHDRISCGYIDKIKKEIVNMVRRSNETTPDSPSSIGTNIPKPSRKFTPLTSCNQDSACAQTFECVLPKTEANEPRKNLAKGFWILVAHEEHFVWPFLQDVSGVFTIRCSMSHGDFAIIKDGVLLRLLERKDIFDLLSSVKSGHWATQRSNMKALGFSSGTTDLLLEERTSSVSQRNLSLVDLTIITTTEHKSRIRDGINVVRTVGILGTVVHLLAASRAYLSLPGCCLSVSNTATKTQSKPCGDETNNDAIRVQGVAANLTSIVPALFRVPQPRAAVPPGNFMAAACGLVRGGTFYRGLGILSRFPTMRALIIFLEDNNQSGSTSEKLKYLASLPYPSKTAIENTSTGGRTGQPNTNNNCTKKRKTTCTVGNGVAASLLYALGFGEEPTPKQKKSAKKIKQATPMEPEEHSVTKED